MLSKRLLIPGMFGLVILAAAIFFLREPDPQGVLRQSTRRLLAEKTFHAELQATIVGLPAGLGEVVSSATGFDILIRSDIDRTDPVAQASVSSFEFRQHLTSGTQAVLSGEARRQAGEHYLRLSALQGVPEFDAGKIVGQWMKSDRAFLDLLFASAGSGRALAAADLEALGSALQSVDLFRVTKKLPKETLDGRKTLHYAVELNMETVSALLLKRRELLSGQPLGSEDVLAVTGELMDWNRPVGEIWVDAKTRAFKRIALGTALGRDGQSGTAAALLAFSNEGKPVAVQVPEAEDAEKILGPLFTKRLSLAGDRSRLVSTSSTKENSTSSIALLPEIPAETNDSDADALVDLQEFFYGADPWNPDTDGDGYSDGLEIDKAMNPISPGRLFGFGL